MREHLFTKLAASHSCLEYQEADHLQQKYLYNNKDNKYNDSERAFRFNALV